jgi:hypothetical protein
MGYEFPPMPDDQEKKIAGKMAGKRGEGFIEIEDNPHDPKTMEKEKQKKVDSLMKELPSLDFKNIKAVLDWLNEFPTDFLVGKKDIKAVLSIFKEHGYKMIVNVGEAYKPEDRDNVARHIIGNSLQFLKDEGNIHDVMLRDIMNWKRKFSS